MGNGDECRVSESQRQYHGPRLHSWSLLGHYKFAAREIGVRLRKQDHQLERKSLFPAGTLVQCLVVTLAKTAQRRMRTPLKSLSVFPQKIIQSPWIAG